MTARLLQTMPLRELRSFPYQRLFIQEHKLTTSRLTQSFLRRTASSFMFIHQSSSHPPPTISTTCSTRSGPNDGQDILLSVPEHSTVLNVVLHIIYDMPCVHYLPPSTFLSPPSNNFQFTGSLQNSSSSPRLRHMPYFSRMPRYSLWNFILLQCPLTYMILQLPPPRIFSLFRLPSL